MRAKLCAVSLAILSVASSPAAQRDDSTPGFEGKRQTNRI
jgi:hypothetical protein